MMLDEGAYLVLRSAAGAFSCNRPPVPRMWDPVDRPHIAQVILDGDRVFRVYLSRPKDGDGSECKELEVFQLDSLPDRSIVEIRYDEVNYSYFRLDGGVWTKVAEGRNPFMVEVFSHGCSPIVMTMAIHIKEASYFSTA